MNPDIENSNGSSESPADRNSYQRYLRGQGADERKIALTAREIDNRTRHPMAPPIDNAQKSRQVKASIINFSDMEPLSVGSRPENYHPVQHLNVIERHMNSDQQFNLNS